MDAYIIGLRRDLRKLHNVHIYDSKFKYLTMIRWESSLQLTKHLQHINEYAKNSKIYMRDPERFGKYLKYVTTAPYGKRNEDRETDGNAMKYICIICNVYYKNDRGYHKHIRVDDDWSMYYRPNAITPEKWRGEGRRA